MVSNIHRKHCFLVFFFFWGGEGLGTGNIVAFENYIQGILLWYINVYLVKVYNIDAHH